MGQRSLIDDVEQRCAGNTVKAANGSDATAAVETRKRVKPGRQKGVKTLARGTGRADAEPGL